MQLKKIRLIRNIYMALLINPELLEFFGHLSYLTADVYTSLLPGVHVELFRSKETFKEPFF